MKNVADILRSETAGDADSVVDEHTDSLEGDGSGNSVKKTGKDEERRDVRGLRKDVMDHVCIEMNQDVEQGYRIVENVVASTKKRIFKTKNPGSGFDVDNMDVDDSRIEDVPETGGISDRVPGDPYEFVSSQRTPRASRRKGRRKENRDKDVMPRLCKQALTLFIDDTGNREKEGQIFYNSVNEKMIDLCPVSERTRNSRDNYEIRDICSKRSNKPERVSGFMTDRSNVIETCASYLKSGNVEENIDGFTQSLVVHETLQNTTSVGNLNVDTQSGDTGDAMMIQYDTCGDTQPFIPEIESCITENDSVNRKGDKSVSNENNDKKKTFDTGKCETEQSATTCTVQGNNHVSEVSISESEQEDAMESMALRDKHGGKRGDNMMLPPQIVEETQIIGNLSEDGADGLTSLSKISVNRDIGEERNVSDGCGFSDDQDGKVDVTAAGERKVAIKQPRRSSLKRKREAERLSRDVTRLEQIATKINQAEDYSLLMCSQDVGLNMTSQMHREVETPMIATSQKAGHIKETFTSGCGASWLRSRTGCLESKTSSGDGIIPDSKITDNISPTPAAYTRELLVKYTTFKEAFNGLELETRIKSSSLERNNPVMFASFDDEKRKPRDKSFLHVRETQLSCDLFSKATGASIEKKTRVKGGAVLLANARLHEIFSESRTGDGVEETYEGLGVPEPISDDSTEDLGIVEENCCYLQPSPESGSTHRNVSETGAGISETSENVSRVGADVFAATAVMFSDENEDRESEHVRIRLNDDWIGKKVVERIPASSVVDLFGGDVDSPGEDTQEYSVLKGSNAQDCCSDAGIVPDCSVDVNRVGACAGFIETRGVDNCYTSEGKSENMNDSKELDTFALGEVISNLCQKICPNEDMRKPKIDRVSCLTVDSENGIIVIEHSLKEPVNKVISDYFTDPCNVVVPETAESGSPFVPQILGFVPDSYAVSVERVSKLSTSGMSSSSSEVFLDPFSAWNKIAASKVFHKHEGLSDGELEAIKSDANEVGSGQPRLKERKTIPNVFDREMYKEVQLLGSSQDKENIEPSVEVLNGKVSREDNFSTIKEAKNICEERILGGDKGHCVSLSPRAESKANQIGLSETSHVQMVCSSLTTARDGDGRLSKSDDTVGYDRHYKQRVVGESCDVLCSIEPDDEGKELSLNSKRIRSSQRKMHEMQQACRKLQSLREYGCEGVETDGICRALERSKSPLLETSGDEDNHVVFKNEVEESSEILDNDYECDIIRNTSVVVNSKEMTQSFDIDPRVYQAECTTVVRGDIDLEKVEVFNDSLKNGDGCLNSETNSDCLTSSYRSLPNTNGGKAIDDMLNDSLLGKIQGHIDQASKLIDRNINRCVDSQLETCDYEVESVERDEENLEVLNNESIDKKDAKEVEGNHGLADSSCLDGAENLLVNTELHTLAKIDGKAGFVEDTIQGMSIENEDADMKVPELEKLRDISTRMDALQNVSILRLDESAVSQFPWSPSPESLPDLDSIFHEEVRGRTGEERRGELNTTEKSVVNGRREVSGDCALKQPEIAEEINDADDGNDASYKRQIDVEDLREVNEKSRNDGIKQSFNDAKLRLSNEQSKARDSKLRTNIDDAARVAEIHLPCIEEIVFDTELSDQGEVSVMDVKVHNKRTTRESCDSSMTSDEGSPVVRKKIKNLATKVLIESSDDDSPRTSPRYGDDSVERREDSRYVAVSEDIKAGGTDEAQKRSIAAISSDSETDVDQVLGDIHVLEVPLSESEQGDPTETMVAAKMTDNARSCGEEHNDDCGLRTVDDEGRSVVSSGDDEEDDEVVIDRLKRKRATISDSDDDDVELPNHADVDHCSNDDNLMDPDHFDADQDTCIDLTHSTISTQSELMATQQRANLQAEMLEMRSKIAELESLLKTRTQAKTSLVRRDCPERTGNTGNAGSRGNRKRQKCREVGSFLDGDSARYSGSIAKNALNSSHCSRQVCDLNRSLNDSCDVVDISRANDFAESLYQGNAADMDDRCAVELGDVVSQRCTELYPGDISPKKLSRVLPEVVGSLRETFATGFKGNKCPSQEFLGDQRHVDVRVDGRHGDKSSSYPQSVSEMAKNSFRRSLFKDGRTNREDKLRRNVCGEENITIEGTLKENPFKEHHKIEQIIPREKSISQKDRVVKADDLIVVPESELLDTCPDSQESKVAILSCVEVVEDSCDDLFNSPTTGSQNDVENPRRSKRRLHERSPRSLLIGSKRVREGNYEEDCGKSLGVRESDKPTMNPESLIDRNSQNMAEGDDVCVGSGNGLLVVENNGFARRNEKMAHGNYKGDDGTPIDICGESEVGIMMSSSEVHRSVSLIDVARSRVAENESMCEYSGLNENEVFGYCREEKSRRECDTSVGLGASVDDSKVLFSEGMEAEKDVIDSVHAKKSAESFGVDETLAVKYRREADDVERAGEVDDCCVRGENSRLIVNRAESALTDGKIDDRTTAGREGTVVCQERVEALNRTVKGGTSRGKGKRDAVESESVIGGESAEEGGGISGASLWQRACMGGSGDEARMRDKITVEVCDLLDDRVTSSQTDAAVECGMRNSVGKLAATGKKRLCFVSSGLRQEQVLNIRRLADRVGALFCDRFSPSVTHVIVKTEGTEDRVCERTLKYLQGVSNHCWVVSYAWVAESLTATDLLPEAAFEMDRDSESGVSHYAPRRARLSQRPPFLSFEFFLHDASDNLPESELRDMLEMGGATVVLDHRFFSFDPRRNCLVIDQSDSTTVTATKLAVYKKFHADFGLTCISRDWALDSIALYRAQPLQRYTLPHTQ